MAFKKRFLFIIGVLLTIGFLSCDKSPSGSEPDPEEPDLPQSIDITAPSASTIYWDDEPITCAHNHSNHADKAEWLVDGELVSCVDGELAEILPDGQHTVTLRFTAEGEVAKKEVEITVKKHFSVTLDTPEAGSEFFVGEEVECSARVTPDTYQDDLQITVGGRDCTGGSVRLQESGELTARAWLTVDNRTESDERAIRAKQAIAGRVYPLTSDGVQDGAGFTVTLKADGEEIDAETDGEGNFAIKSDRISELGGEEVTLEVAESGSFYGSRAVLPAEELLALVESDELGFILAPRRWHIRDGKLSGKSANLKLKAAFTRIIADDSGSSFYKLTKVFGKYKYNSVFSEELPLLVAFNRAKSDVEITASDSTDFWQQTDTVTESYVGRGNLFIPTTIDQIPTVFDGIHVYSGKAGDRSGASGAPGENGYIVGGHIDLALDKFGGYIQTHEQIHNLSFGHASQWDGLMTYEIFDPQGERIRVPGKGMKQLSVVDVAHIQVYIDAFDLQLEQDISFGVLEWMQALDIKGLPETTSSQAKVTGKHAGSYHYETVECQIH